MLYKHTIFPFLEYFGFMLVSCNIEDGRELQKCQNDSLRICTRVNLADHVKIEDLHSRCKIVSLEQRRRAPLMLLMYKKSKDITMHKVFARNTRVSRRIVFKTDSFEGTLYKRSPYFVGANCWDKISLDTIEQFLYFWKIRGYLKKSFVIKKKLKIYTLTHTTPGSPPPRHTPARLSTGGGGGYSHFGCWYQLRNYSLHILAVDSP